MPENKFKKKSLAFSKSGANGIETSTLEITISSKKIRIKHKTSRGARLDCTVLQGPSGNFNLKSGIHEELRGKYFLLLMVPL